jgi:hypothetical protein
MSATTWEPKFQKHLKSLEGWKVYTTNSGSHMTQKLQMQMVQDARYALHPFSTSLSYFFQPLRPD